MLMLCGSDAAEICAARGISSRPALDSTQEICGFTETRSTPLAKNIDK
jgi:hypothetical protein